MAFLKELALAYLTGPFYELPDDALQQKLFFLWDILEGLHS